MDEVNSSGLPDRLRHALDSIAQLTRMCGSPSTSVGVLHQGRVVLAESVGQRDASPLNAASQDSVYLLGSLSKAFVAAAIGILVDEGKMEWTDLVSKHVPDFHPIGDPRITAEADFIDLLRHSSGLVNPVVQVLGPHGIIISREDKFMDMVNQAPTSDDDGQCFNRVWEYSNISYGIAAVAVEHVSGIRFADFLKTRILVPLGMAQTAVTEEDVNSCGTLADGYALLDDGTFVQVPVEWTSETHTSVLAPYGIRSSVHDVLIWCAAWLSAEEHGMTRERPEALRSVLSNPLRQVPRILKPAWMRPFEDPYQNESAYCIAWLRAVMPTAALNWGAVNNRTVHDKDRTYLQYILGTQSPNRVVYKHTGIAYNTVSALFLFPETQSAVIALSNGRRNGDASDFAAQLLIQELFDLQPRVDVLSRATLETQRGQDFRHRTVMRDWLENRDVSGPEREAKDFVGDYEAWATELHVRQDDSTKKLTLHFNDRSDMVVSLEYYRNDAYSFLPTTADQHFSGGFMDYDFYMVGILEFKRNDEGIVNGLFWMWEEESPATWYERKAVPSSGI